MGLVDAAGTDQTGDHDPRRAAFPTATAGRVRRCRARVRGRRAANPVCRPARREPCPSVPTFGHGRMSDLATIRQALADSMLTLEDAGVQVSAYLIGTPTPPT